MLYRGLLGSSAAQDYSRGLGPFVWDVHEAAASLLGSCEQPGKQQLSVNATCVIIDGPSVCWGVGWGLQEGRALASMPCLSAARSTSLAPSGNRMWNELGRWSDPAGSDGPPQSRENLLRAPPGVYLPTFKQTPHPQGLETPSSLFPSKHLKLSSSKRRLQTPSLQPHALSWTHSPVPKTPGASPWRSTSPLHGKGLGSRDVHGSPVAPVTGKNLARVLHRTGTP